MSCSQPSDTPESASPERGTPTAADESSEQSPSKSDEPGSDVVLVHGVTPDGEGLEVIRRRQGRLEAGAARPLKHGQPIAGEVVRLKPRKEFPLLCDVEVEVGATAAAPPAPSAWTASRKGPPRVATQRYRDNWDAIWSTKRSDETLLN